LLHAATNATNATRTAMFVFECILQEGVTRETSKRVGLEMSLAPQVVEVAAVGDAHGASSGSFSGRFYRAVSAIRANGSPITAKPAQSRGGSPLAIAASFAALSASTTTAPFDIAS